MISPTNEVLMRVFLTILVIIAELTLLFAILAVSADPDFSSMTRQFLTRRVAMNTEHDPVIGSERAPVIVAGAAHDSVP
jgi:hypothetical protein